MMKRSRLLLSITIVFFWASEYCHMPYFTPYLQTLGFTASLIGIMTGMYGFTQMLVRIPLGIVTDVTGCYKKTILMGTIFTTVSSFGLIFATHFVTIIICRILAGIAASSWLAFTILYAAYYEADESVQAVTNVNAFNSAGKLIAFILGLITASLWGYRIPLICSFLTGIVAIICAVQLKPIALKREPFQVSHVIAVFSNPAVLCASFFAIIMQAFLQGTVFSFTSTVAKELGASAFEIGFNTVLFTLVQILAASFIGKKVLKKLNTSQAVAIGFFAMAFSCLLVAYGKNMCFLYAAQIIGGVSNLMANSVLMSMIIRFVPQENQSTAMGMFQALYGIGMTLGPVMTGQIAGAAGYGTAYLVMGAMTFIAALLAPVMLKKMNR
ncbi:MAG: MFS transporter [Hungatella sp.]|nr:MFS transporter [Hungatella sp.]